MDSLEQKYRDNKLSTDELMILRKRINSMSDDQLDKDLSEAWEICSAGEMQIEDWRMEKVKKRIESRLSLTQSRYHIYKKVIQFAAAILLPVFMLTTYYLHRENAILTEKDFVVSTAEGEQVTVSLPDGTQVTLNSESRLMYNLSNFNSKTRKVFFEGEGLFRVAKDMNSPFSIDGKDLRVSVLGTTFNLRTRTFDETAELFLEEGSVNFLSLKTGQEVILKPNQKAILYREGGKIVVKEDLNVTDASAWQRGELVFRNVPFAEVLEEIAGVYHVNVEIDGCADAYQKDLFTGVLSRTNINEVLDVIEKSYHLNAVLKDGRLYLRSLN